MRRAEVSGFDAHLALCLLSLASALALCPDKVRLRLSTHVFLLSPAWCGGKRAKMLLNPAASFDLAVRLRRGTLSLGEAFAFMSGLYFRGKLAYGSRFGPAIGGRDRTFVITPTQGLRSPVSAVTIGSAARVRVGGRERGRSALPRAARARSPRARRVAGTRRARRPARQHRDVQVRGRPPAASSGRASCFPPSFIGRGDMSRGGLLLRAAREGVELEYAPLDSVTQRHGPRPPKLEPDARYSCRNTSTGSTDAARRAGHAHASDRHDDQHERHADERRRIGRARFEEQAWRARACEKYATTTPATRPMAAGRAPCAIISRTTLARVAPSAIRTPISRVRCATA